MKIPEPTRTIGRLHFSDLSPSRFEDLCHALLYPLNPWVEIRLYGQSGADGGIDILAREQLDNGKQRVWAVQCRRYKNASLSDLKKAGDDALKGLADLPDVLLVVVACDVRRAAHEAFIKHALAKGVNMPLLWTASNLETRLYCDRKDLLFTFFGVSEIAATRSRESAIRRNISLKQRMRKDFLKPKIGLGSFAKPYEDFRVDEAIVHSIDDVSYPNSDKGRVGISGWFRVEFYSFYFNGIEVILTPPRVIMDSNGRWATIKYGESFDSRRFAEADVFKVGRIPFSNIVDYDLEGDEYYPGAHLYCSFSSGGTPYEGYRHILSSGRVPVDLDPAMRLEP